MFRGKAYDELAIGDSFESSLTITETHLVMAAAFTADYNPLHVNQSFAEKSRFGGRILHGVATSAIVGGPVGMIFHGTAIAYLEHACRFLAPVRPGDTLTTTWTVVDRIDKPSQGGGIAVMKAVCRNQDGTVVAEADGKMLARNAASA